MSLRTFNGSLANPAQSAVNLGGNNLTNVNDAQATTLTVVNAADLQTLSFKNTGSHGATGTITYVPSDVRFTCDQNFDIDGTASVGGNFEALSTMSVGGTATFSADIEYGIYNISGSGDVSSGNCRTKQSIITGATGTDAIIQMLVAADPFPTDDEKGFIFFNKDAGFSFTNPSSDTTFSIGVGGTAGATGGALVYVRGNNGNGRVYDTVYNPVPSVQTYGQFLLNATFNIGSTGGTAAGVADTATQVSLDTDVISEGCSLSSGGISVAAAGKYNITVSPQFYNTGSGSANVYFWFRVNSTDVANSSTGVYLVGNGAQLVPTVSVVLDLAANDVVKIMAAANDDEIQCLNVGAISSPYSRPAAPAIIATIVRAA
jgi:hypothetical protein